MITPPTLDTLPALPFEASLHGSSLVEPTLGGLGPVLIYLLGVPIHL